MGATGSIGTQTLDVLRREAEDFSLEVIAGGTRADDIVAIAREFGVRTVIMATSEAAETVHRSLPTATVEVGGAAMAAASADVDVVVNAVMGFAGLPVTLAALAQGKRLALANKESLIAAAPLVERVRHTAGAELLPIDSEHCAIHQCLRGSTHPGHPDVARLILTASGGPFRGWTAAQLQSVTREQALAHPTWSMGQKITIDSSTLMNKGLEVLEAAALFDVSVERVDVVVHPESIVHSMVEYVDGSVMAQMSRPDMRLPIAYCLGLPERLPHAWGAMDFSQSFSLHFEPPSRENFPALDLAYAAARRGGAAPAWLSAANEVAVAAFLDNRIAWKDIVAVVAATMDRYGDVAVTSVEGLMNEDAQARRLAGEVIAR
jgi:1-deoxy-D-xylulose-5-phosphate reductoisomerase